MGESPIWASMSHMGESDSDLSDNQEASVEQWMEIVTDETLRSSNSEGAPTMPELSSTPKTNAIAPWHGVSVRILVTGASGFLGQHVISELVTNAHYEVFALYNSMTGFAVTAVGKCQGVASVDITDSIQVDRFLAAHDPFHVCLHLAALSAPRQCHEDPDRAQALNVPIHLLDSLTASGCRIIALSTDQVYGGDKGSPYTEDDKLNPLNVYSKTKVALERHLQPSPKETRAGNPKGAEPNFSNDPILLRSSILLGPIAPLCHDAHDTFLHFCASRQHVETTFFTDECRSVMAVSDVVKLLVFLVDHHRDKQVTAVPGGVYNMGGPDRVSRYDMAMAVAKYFEWKDVSRIVPAKKADQSPGPVASPLDITMDSTKLQQLVGFDFLTLDKIVKATFDPSDDKKI